MITSKMEALQVLNRTVKQLEEITDESQVLAKEALDYFRNLCYDATYICHVGSDELQ